MRWRVHPRGGGRHTCGTYGVWVVWDDVTLAYLPSAQPSHGVPRRCGQAWVLPPTLRQLLCLTMTLAPTLTPDPPLPMAPMMGVTSNRSSPTRATTTPRPPSSRTTTTAARRPVHSAAPWPTRCPQCRPHRPSRRNRSQRSPSRSSPSRAWRVLRSAAEGRGQPMPPYRRAHTAVGTSPTPSQHANTPHARQRARTPPQATANAPRRTAVPSHALPSPPVAVLAIAAVAGPLMVPLPRCRQGARRALMRGHPGGDFELVANLKCAMGHNKRRCV